MSVKLSSLQNQLHEVKVTVKVKETGEERNETLTVRYKPLTLRKIREIKEQGEDNIARQLSAIIVDLDLIDEQGTKIQPTVEVLENLDLDFLRSVASAIFGDQSPNPKNASTFGGGY